METLQTINETLGNTKAGLALALTLVLQYAIISGMLVTGFYRKRPLAFFWNVIPFYWLVKLLAAITVAFYETTILRNHKNLER